MRTYGDKPLADYEINELPNGMAEITLFENVKKVKGGGHVYDLHQVVVPYRESLSFDIEENIGKWIVFAREVENQTHPPSPEDRLATLERERAQTKADVDYLAIMTGVDL